MLVVELTDGSTFDCTGYDEADNGLEFTYDDEFKVYAPCANVRCIYRAGAPGETPGGGGSDDDNDNSPDGDDFDPDN